MAMVATTALPLALATAATVAAAGGLMSAAEALRVGVAQVGAVDYIRQFGGGAWYRYVVDFILVSPWTAMLYLMWLGMLIAERRVPPRLLAWVILPVLFVTGVSATWKFIRWALPLDVPIRLGAVLAVQRMVGGRPGSRIRSLALAAVLAGLMAVDVRSFFTLFVAADVYDPASALLLWYRGFLPH
jgi:hypothetical protein